MSILKKPYEISVWKDEWSSSENCFLEKMIGIIGSDKMYSQNRALEPCLTRNSNGQRSFTFKMYSQYRDNTTGEEIINPFFSWLVNDRKIKLKYGEKEGLPEKWYDFIIVNIEENSTTHLYTYQLEDAQIRELSKNGYGVILDPKLLDKNGVANTGTLETLANKVLADTNWNVETEKFIQKVEEALVYVAVSPEAKIFKIRDDNLEAGLTPEEVAFDSVKLGLAFYSCCRERPHRFQFIYLPDYSEEQVKRGEDRIITERNCQYYIDFGQINKYSDAGNGYYLPEGVALANPSSHGYQDTQISTLYRGARYGYTQKAEYIPLLDQYCKKYKKGGVDYYGYTKHSYISPALTTNIINNPEFQGKKGWFGSYSGNADKATRAYGVVAEGVYGYFSKTQNTAGTDETVFVSITDDLMSGKYSDQNKYSPYLKVTVPNSSEQNTPILINTGFYDQRVTIGSVNYDEEWVLDLEWLDDTGNPIYNVSDIYDCSLREVRYNVSKEKYELQAQWATSNSEQNILTFRGKDDTAEVDVNISADLFKEKEIKLVIEFKPNLSNKVYYLSSAELYKKIVDKSNNIIRPGQLDQNEILLTEYCFFRSDALTNQEDGALITDPKALSIETVSEINYEVYVPNYNEDGEKTRSVSVQESNYFNILQTLAEAFEAWLSLEIERVPETGEIIRKTAKFKNYVGKDNYAPIQYGVNLIDITRTRETKNIVTKLIVKNNNNEYAPDGKASIARASMNPTGEGYIYDFSYYLDTGLFDTNDYENLVWGSLDGAEGPDLGSGHEYEDYNLIGYFSRLKQINTSIEGLEGDISAIESSLTTLKGKKVYEETRLKEATSELENIKYNFLSETGYTPEEIGIEDIAQVSCTIPNNNDPVSGIDVLNTGVKWATGAQITQTQESNKVEFTFSVQLPSLKTKDHPIAVALYPGSSSTRSWDFVNNILKITKHELIEQVDENGNVIRDSEGNVATITQAINNRARLELVHQYQDKTAYTFKYTFTPLSSTVTNPIKNIGCCFDYFNKETATMKLYENTESDGTFLKRAQAGGPLEYEFQQNKTYVIVCEANCDLSQEIGSQSRGLSIIPNIDKVYDVECKITNISLSSQASVVSSSTRSLFFAPKFTILRNSEDAENNTIEFQPLLSCPIAANASSGSLKYSVCLVDTNKPNIISMLTSYATCKQELLSATEKLDGVDDEIGLRDAVSQKEAIVASKRGQISALMQHKKALNNLFYETYSSYINEGTWQSEDYTDNNEYYIDAMSVIHNSNKPKVAYSINVMSLGGLPGYEDFSYDPGDKAKIIDRNFFGNDYQEEVVITELSQFLDEPSKDTIIVQNFKEDFSDLFQKITATVQQVEYRQGSYEKAASLAEADAKRKNEFLQDALENVDKTFSEAGQTSVTKGPDGITLTDSYTNDQMRLIGGGILISSEDEHGVRSWKAGLTADGLSASLITAGVLDVGTITIKNAKDPIFKWDAYGLTAYDVLWNESGIGAPNTRKFVRFDKYGIYGIDTSNKAATLQIDGSKWYPQSIFDVENQATFSLTWQGLKISTTNNKLGTEKRTITALIGKSGQNIIDVNVRQNGQDQKIFSINDSGEGVMGGWTLSPKTGYNGGLYHDCSTTYTDSSTGEQKTKKFRVGIKTENGIPDAFSFYVRRYKGTEEQGEAPKGEVIFGVKHDGSIKATAGEIAGWHLKNDRLYYGDIGTTSSFHMYTNEWGAIANDIEIGGHVVNGVADKEHPGWKLTIGDSFGVTADGKLYCTGGKIGGWTIENKRDFAGLSSYSISDIYPGWYQYNGTLLSPKGLQFQAYKDQNFTEKETDSLLLGFSEVYSDIIRPALLFQSKAQNGWGWTYNQTSVPVIYWKAPSETVEGITNEVRSEIRFCGARRWLPSTSSMTPDDYTLSPYTTGGIALIGEVFIPTFSYNGCIKQYYKENGVYTWCPVGGFYTWSLQDVLYDLDTRIRGIEKIAGIRQNMWDNF